MLNFLTQIDFSKLSDKDYILQTSPDPTGLYKYLLIIFGLMFVAAFILIFKKPKEVYRKLYSKLIGLLLIVGLSGLALVFFRWQAIPYLNSRLLFVILVFIFLLWLSSIIYYYLLILPKEIKQKQKKENFEKYLPTSKANMIR